MFKDYGEKFWEPFWRCVKRQAHFLCWYYIAVGAWAFLVGTASKKYGQWKRNRIYSFIADVYLLPHLSQWHALLTGFTFPDKTKVRADALMSDDTLYRGEIAEYFLNGDGSLAGLFLRSPERFDRARYVRERTMWGTTRPAKEFWREIPSAKLYLLGSKIVNLNLNYEPSSAPIDVVQKYVKEYLRSFAKVATVTVQSPTHDSIAERAYQKVLDWKSRRE